MTNKNIEDMSADEFAAHIQRQVDKYAIANKPKSERMLEVYVASWTVVDSKTGESHREDLLFGTEKLAWEYLTRRDSTIINPDVIARTIFWS